MINGELIGGLLVNSFFDLPTLVISLSVVKIVLDAPSAEIHFRAGGCGVIE